MIRLIRLQVSALSFLVAVFFLVQMLSLRKVSRSFPEATNEVYNDGPTTGAVNKMKAAIDLGDNMDQVVRLLLDGPEAEDYIRKNPGRDFRFYVYETLPDEWTYSHVNDCVFSMQHAMGNKSTSFKTSTCDWGLSICTEEETGTTYASRRFNRNADAILSRIFSE